MNIAKMEAEYNATIEDIAVMDKNIHNEVKKHFSGTGTLWQNELYAHGKTTETDVCLDAAFNILQSEIDKRNLLITELKKVYPNKNLKSYGYNELLYLTAGLYNRKKSKES